MNVGLFGGTFDPIHRGHVAVARAAQQRFNLARILFVPAGSPPHKKDVQLTSFPHRYAMTALATLGEKSFIPSDIESTEQLQNRPSYSIDTVRRVKAQLKKSDHLYFLIGMDAFREIASWREPEALLREVEFIVMARPGYSLGDVGASLTESLKRPTGVTKALKAQPAAGEVVLAGATLHLLPETHEKVSATQIRAAARSGRKLDALVGAAVADYIRKTGLYRDAVRTTRNEKQTSQSRADTEKVRS
jgi:nicotinate-nucleotide adenylyltransferase